MGRRLGLFRAVYLASASCMGSFAFAFDTGVISGVLTLPSFQRDFRYGDSQRKTINSNAVSILQASAFFGCFFTMPIASKLGRLSGLILSALVFTVGTILQVMNAHTLGAFYAGKVIAGVGIGAATTLIPMFSAEMAPKEIRGRLGACLVIALGLQLLPSTLLLVGMCTKEFDEILAGIEEESRIKGNFTIRELLLPVNRYRLFIAFTIQLCAQLTGNTSLAYYANQIFEAVGAEGKTKLVTGFFGVVKVVGVCIFQLFVLDRVGRRVPFMVGAFAMGSAGIAMIIMAYAEAFSFNMSWGRLPRTREVGVAVGAASQWLFNFMMSQITPHAISNIKWRIFPDVCDFQLCDSVLTSKHSLEEMQEVFGGGDPPKEANIAEDKGQIDATVRP
ncbi:hypothetical protein BDV29DRAFT_196976 [Aspergillus leporis]|uniref:Major facilitator superfamily (MFS) profile domain-containing protein n=1 Tax=Aspergillus leporis TaxID=41062 RepID=A0A5N5WUN4_9EURO|nr:hypothetical protein BDV29DRAFT_196976 [Aspergillus leporis]